MLFSWMMVPSWAIPLLNADALVIFLYQGNSLGGIGARVSFYVFVILVLYKPRALTVLDLNLLLL
ncbi:hypothetical protein ACSBR2_017524 [Camellia fascicularis]